MEKKIKELLESVAPPSWRSVYFSVEITDSISFSSHITSPVFFDENNNPISPFIEIKTTDEEKKQDFYLRKKREVSKMLSRIVVDKYKEENTPNDEKWKKIEVRYQRDGDLSFKTY